MKSILTACIVVVSLTLNAQSSITGVWILGQENTRIQIVEEEGVASATIYSTDNDKLEVGTPFLKEIVLKGDEWKGKMYSFKKKKWFNATFTENGDKLKVKVKAGVMRKKLEWTKE